MRFPVSVAGIIRHLHQGRRSCQTSLLILFLFFAFGLQRFACVGQENGIHELSRGLFEDVSSNPPLMVASFDSLGKFVHSQARSASIMNDGPLPFLENTNLMKELEPSSTQEEAFAKVVKEWRLDHENSRRKLSKIHTGPFLTEGEQTQLQKKFDKRHEQGWEEINDVLLPFQKDRLSQVQMRYYIRIKGVKAFVSEPRIADFLGLTKVDGDEMVRTAKLKRSDLKKKAIEARIECVEQILQGFTAEQKSNIHAKWPYLKSTESDFSEQFRIHLLQIQDFEFLDEFDSVVSKAQNFPLYEMSVSGKYEPRILDAKMIGHVKKIENIDLVRHFFSLLDSTENENSWNHTEHQIDRSFAIKEGHLSRLRQEEDMDRELNRGRERTIYEESDAILRIHETIAEQTVRRIQDCLTDQQRQELEAWYAKLLERKYGSLWDITKGSLSEELKMTDEQKAEIKSNGKIALKQFESKLSEIEKEWLEQIFSSKSDN